MRRGTNNNKTSFRHAHPICGAVSGIVFKVFLAVMLIGFCAGCRMVEDTDKLGNDILIDGLDVSGMTVSEAREALIKHHEALLSDIDIKVRAGDREITRSAQELGFEYDTEAALMEAATMFPLSTHGSEITGNIELSHASAQVEAEEIAQYFENESTNATARYENGEMVFEEGEPSQTIDTDELLSALEGLLDENGKFMATAIELSNISGEADNVTVDALKGENVLIASYTTYFNESPYNAENRVKNVKKAAELIDGTVLKAGESFDTNQVLGDRNSENGWSKAPGIRNGKYEMEYGGGVCQVSSTLYNAALIANLDITERHPHSWPMGYVPIGRDATISTDGPNLIFKNSTDGTITIGVIIDDEAESVTVRIFGTPPEGYKNVELMSQETEVIPHPEAEIITDEDMDPGEEIEDRKARDGRVVVTYRIFYDENGQEIEREVVTEDTYRPIAARIIRGA